MFRNFPGLLKTIKLLLWGILFPGLVFSQTLIKGNVYDGDTGLPLPYVNIGFIERGLGTVSEENGSFNFSFNSSMLTELDTLKVSYLAYKEYKIPFSQILSNQYKPFEINLEPDVLSLNEVVLTSSKRQKKSKNEKMVGYSYVGQLKNGSWEGDGALGGELITKINVSNKQRQLNAFYFYVLENKSDSLLVRVNIYDGSTKVPEQRLTNKSIVYTIKTKVGKVGIDLKPYDIIVQDDFSIGIELLKVYGNQLGLIVAGDDTPGVSYRRYASQGEWKRYPKDALTYFVSTTLLEDSEAEEDLVLLEENLITHYTNEQLLQSMGRNIGVVSGFVFYEGERTKGVQVQNLFSKEVTTTDESGRYTIRANIGDELKFSYASMQSELRTVLETTFAINVALSDRVIELDEVEVSGNDKKKRTQQELFRDFDEDKEIIKTSFGIYSKETLGYSMKILDESEIANGASTLGNLLRGKIPGLTMRSNDNMDGTTEIYLRQAGTNNPIPAAYEVDGIIVSGFPNFLDVSQIKRIAVLSGMASVAKYGTIGAGGVIIINTKAANFSSNTTMTNGEAGFSKEINTISEDETRRNWPDFLQELYEADEFENAKKIFTTYEPQFGTNPNFNIDALNYFLDLWPKESFTEELVNQVSDRFNNDFHYKKALAFLMDKSRRNDRSVQLYKQLLVFKSNSPQTYRDLANAYVENGQIERGKSLYARYFNLIKEGFFARQPDALQQVINTEVKVLLDIEEEQLASPLVNLINNEESKTRILLEWNDDSAELDFQFVDPGNTISTWSNANDGESGESLVLKGFTSKDFFIYGNEDAWKINSLYRGNRSGLATYLKITISTDYGTDNQKDNIQIFRMDVKNVNRRLLQVP